MARLLVTARLSDAGAVERLRAGAHDVLERDDPRPAPPDELRRLAADRDGLLCMPADRIDAAFLDACPSVRFLANHAVGTDNIDLAAAEARGVAVANTLGVLNDATADLCVGLVLAAGRRIAEGDRLVRAGGWEGFSTDLLLGLDLNGATVGLVGVGGIGAAVARRLVAGFGMRGRDLARSRHPELERELGIAPARPGRDPRRGGRRHPAAAPPRRDPRHVRRPRTRADAPRRGAGQRLARGDRRRAGARGGAPHRPDLRRARCLRGRAAPA